MTDSIQELPPIEERPLVTFVLVSYNQERYIREAVEGAFAQTYEPLEIILSDDCSTDQTFEIIKKMAVDYVGPHKILLNRNEENMGISPHVRLLHEISRGQYIVHAAGDDYSYPHRVEKVVLAFISMNPQPSIVTSNSAFMDADSKVNGCVNKKMTEKMFEKQDNPLNRRLPLNGHTISLHRSLVDKFSRPYFNIIAEDSLLTARAHLLNGVLYIPDVLMNYRVSQSGAWSSNMLYASSSAEVINRQLKWSLDYVKRMRQLIFDVDKVFLSDKLRHDISKEAAFNINNSLRLVELINSGPTKGFALIITCFLIHPKLFSQHFLLMKIYFIKWFPFLRKLKHGFKN